MAHDTGAFPSRTVAVGIPTFEAYALLPLPPLYQLTTQMLAGRVCAFGGEDLETETAVDLGEAHDADGVLMFPRACHPCAAKAARDARVAHADDCVECRQEDTSCEVGRAFRRIERTGRR